MQRGQTDKLTGKLIKTICNGLTSTTPFKFLRAQ